MTSDSTDSLTSIVSKIASKNISLDEKIVGVKC